MFAFRRHSPNTASMDGSPTAAATRRRDARKGSDCESPADAEVDARYLAPLVGDAAGQIERMLTTTGVLFEEPAGFAANI